MDADRVQDTWDHWYKKIYIKQNWIFWDLFDFENINNGSVSLKNEYTWSSDETTKYSKEYAFWNRYKEIFKLSGDCDFGMKNFDDYSSKQYKFPNFSLIPVTGGLNNKKGSWIQPNCAPPFHDRFDLFIYHLNQFYLQTNEDEKKAYAKKYFWWNGQKKESTLIYLYDFLNLFDDIYDYCRKMYFIEESLVYMLIKTEKQKSKMNKIIACFHHYTGNLVRNIQHNI